MKYVDVILPLPIALPLTYGIPLEWQGLVMRGMRVEVAFGRNKVYSGIAYRLHDEKPEAYTIRPLRNIIDKEAVVSADQLALWDWVASYYACSLGEVMQAALPAHMKLMNESVLYWDERYVDVPQGLSDDAFLIAELLLNKKVMTIQEFRYVLEGRNLTKVLDELISSGIIFFSETLQEKYKPKTEKRIVLGQAFKEEEAVKQLFSTLSAAPKQLALLFKFLELGRSTEAVPVRELLKAANAGPVQIKALKDKGVFEETEVEVDRVPFNTNKEPLSFELNPEQEEALLAIKNEWKDKDTVLLQGVTGSGKTMIYIRLLQEAVRKGRQALLLLPEIALTTHIVSRLVSFFGDELGVYHSRFSDNERIEIWNKVQQGKYKVIIGPRSALWLPFADLEYIIVDEEHDSSYKQHDPAPRFHTRDTAVVYAAIKKAKVLLGSATPSVESWWNTRNGKYGLVTLQYRYGDAVMPQVHIVSSRNYVPALSDILTQPLLEEIAATINEGRQVILFQNKRGYAPFVICGNCGWVPKCRNCDVSLTYHKHSDKMHCHYCAQKYPRVQVCGQCGAAKVTARSFGTERVEEELQKVFKGLAIGRLDWDVVKGKNSYRNIIESFERGHIRVLVGTQMVVKGLDFSNVGLVGVLSADSLLSYPDFRVNERAFQILVQVSGRSGRKDRPGKVIIQAHNAGHPVLQHVANSDYASFFASEIQTRKEFLYPPFTRMIRIVARHRMEDTALRAASICTEAITKTENIQVSGPAPALVSRIKNQYIFETWIRTVSSAQHLAGLKEELKHAIRHTSTHRGMSGVFFYIDVDPY